MPKLLKQEATDISNAFTEYSLWEGGGSSSLSTLTDVQLTELEDSDVLKYNGEKWVNERLDEVKVNKSYSTQPQVIGTWVDGKPIYECCFISTQSRTINQYNWVSISDIPLNNTNCANVISAKVINIQSEGGVHYPLIASKNTNDYLLVLGCRPDGTYITNGSVFVIQYTKPNDPTTIPVANVLHNYSTDEQIVGTWIDGSPLYEKTYWYPNGVPLQTNVWRELDNLTSLNIDYTKPIIIDGSIKYAHESWAQLSAYRNSGLVGVMPIVDSTSKMLQIIANQNASEYSNAALLVKIQYCKV